MVATQCDRKSEIQDCRPEGSYMSYGLDGGGRMDKVTNDWLDWGLL